jgi:acyl-CoA synthetase (NDP forming)
MQHKDEWKHQLDPVIYPKSIAIVGASDAPGSWADIIYGNIAPGSSRPIYPVHPKKDSIWGKPCFKSIEDVKDDIDLAVFLIAGHRIPDALEQCASKNVKAALVLSAGFAELKSEEGRVLQNRLKMVAEKAHIRVIGPNCLGTISFHGGVSCFAGLLPDPMLAGRFGAVSQSGSFCLGIMNAAEKRGLGLSCLFSSGNEAVLESSDYIHYLLDDPNTKVVGAFIEGFKDPEKFLQVADLALEKEKPLVIMKVGRSQKAVNACRSHTGSLVGAEDVQDAIFQQKNVVRVESIDEMIDTAKILIHRKPIRKGGVSFVGLSGGICAYISDNMERLKVDLPDFSEEGRTALEAVLPDYAVANNPLDSTGQARIDLTISYRTIDTMIQETTNDLFFYNLASFDDFEVENMRKIAEYVAEKAQNAGKFVGIHMLNVETWPPRISEFYRKNPVAILQGGFEPIRNLIRYSKRMEAIKASPVATAGRLKRDADVDALFAKNAGRALTEGEGHSVLSRYGIPSPEGRSCSSVDAALACAKAIGYPVALKIDSAQISHKTDIGAVLLNIPNDAKLKASYTRIMANCRKEHPAIEDLNVLVQRMAPDGIDVILGMKMDEQFGPAIVLGMGGVLVEVLRDTAIRVAPIRHTEAMEMIRELSGFRLLEGYRGKPAADIQALAEAIVHLSEFAKQHENQLLSLDVNPLRVLEKGKGVIALDALLELR